MTQLTIDLQTSAQVLGTSPEHFLNWLQNEHPNGIVSLTNVPQISIFTLARILDTTPKELLDLLENSQQSRSTHQEISSQADLTEELTDKETPIWEVFANFAQSLPQEVIDSLPTDGAVNHDHYLYGAPKLQST